MGSIPTTRANFPPGCSEAGQIVATVDAVFRECGETARHIPPRARLVTWRGGQVRELLFARQPV